jgi:tRNA-splicing ligase RtcB
MSRRTLGGYGEDHDEKTLEQIRTCAATADRAALMVDGHLGYAVPIGGVVACPKPL